MIGGDTKRPTKTPLTPRKDAPLGEVALLAFDDQDKEAAGVADLVTQLISQGVPAGEILILSRTDRSGGFSKPIKKLLLARGVDAYNPDYVDDLLAEPSNRRFLERVRLLVDEDDSIAWASLFHLVKGISKTFHDHIVQCSVDARKTFGATLLAERDKNFPGAPKVSSGRAGTLVDEIRRWVSENRPPSGEVSWGRWLTVLRTDPEWTPSTELGKLLVALDDLTETESELSRYLGQVAPLGRDLALAQDQGVRFMTMMGSKGLTVRATILIGAEDGLIPRPEADLAEERRLLYVALTRSTESVFCTWARRRYGQTARVGARLVGGLRQPSAFFRSGPVCSQDGRQYLNAMAAKSGAAV